MYVRDVRYATTIITTITISDGCSSALTWFDFFPYFTYPVSPPFPFVPKPRPKKQKNKKTKNQKTKKPTSKIKNQKSKIKNQEMSNTQTSKPFNPPVLEIVDVSVSMVHALSLSVVAAVVVLFGGAAAAAAEESGDQMICMLGPRGGMVVGSDIVMGDVEMVS